MFFHRVRLFSLFGFEVSVDASWLLLAILVTWTLAVSAFPQLTPGLDSLSYWLMGAAATAGLLLSIVFHEMAHSLVARHYGIPIRGITLFIFGGVAEMTEETRPSSGRAVHGCGRSSRQHTARRVSVSAVQRDRGLEWPRLHRRRAFVSLTD